ncbi:UvrB/UvrC motif-containing protein [candidate division WOR-3 bacterium]|nr:UvrB/UvrC motif-containing protein [candidate division WOR-3 bacterium]
MLCDICHKEEATVFYSIIINNQKTELHLCEECAAKKGLIKPPLPSMFKEFLPLMPHEPEFEKLKCLKCGLTYKEFRRLGKFGCPECYKAFEKKILPLLRKIHGNTQHIGKTTLIQAKKYEKESKLFELKQKLKKAVEDESYEEAAHIRDEIKKLNKHGGTLI